MLEEKIKNNIHSGGYYNIQEELDIRKYKPINITKINDENIAICCSNEIIIIKDRKKPIKLKNFYYPQGIVQLENGMIYICDTGYNCIKIYNKEFKFIGRFGSFGTDRRQFKKPRGIICLNNWLYICDSDNKRIVKYNTENIIIKKSGEVKIPKYVNGKKSIEIIKLDFRPRQIRLIDDKIYITTENRFYVTPDGKKANGSNFSDNNILQKNMVMILEPVRKIKKIEYILLSAYDISKVSDKICIIDNESGCLRFFNEDNILIETYPSDTNLKSNELFKINGILELNDNSIMICGYEIHKKLNIFKHKKYFLRIIKQNIHNDSSNSENSNNNYNNNYDNGAVA